MPQTPTTRCQFLRQLAVALSAAATVHVLFPPQPLLEAAEVDRSITVRNPPAVRQIDVLFDPANYTAFPHVERLDGDELLMAFRQAPSQERVRHTHPRSVITVVRSYDLGNTWDIENAGQLAAGGGQEFAPIYLGNGAVGGLLAMHKALPVKEGKRTGIPHVHQHEYLYRNVGGFWCWSNDYGLYARLSENGGKTWSETSWLLRAAPNSNLGYSSSVEIEPSRIFTACYAQNNDGVTGITGTFWDLPPR